MILMLAPGPNMTFVVNGSTYVSDNNALIEITNNSVADQLALEAAGCETLTTDAASDPTIVRTNGSFAMGGAYDVTGGKLSVQTPAQPTDAARKDYVDSAIGGAMTGAALGVVSFATKANMDADLAHAAGTIAFVYNDGTAKYNRRFYGKLGASGSGSWAANDAFTDYVFKTLMLGEDFPFPKLVSMWDFSNVGGTTVRDLWGPNDIDLTLPANQSYVLTGRSVLLSGGMIQTPSFTYQEASIFYRCDKNGTAGALISYNGGGSTLQNAGSATNTYYGGTGVDMHIPVNSGSGTYMNELNRGFWGLLHLAAGSPVTGSLAFGGRGGLTTYRCGTFDAGIGFAWNASLTSSERSALHRFVRRWALAHKISFHAADCPNQVDLVLMVGDSITGGRGCHYDLVPSLRSKPMSSVMIANAAQGWSPLDVSRNAGEATEASLFSSSCFQQLGFNNFSNGDTQTVGTVTYTFVTSLSGGGTANQIPIQSRFGATVDKAVLAINGTGVAGTDYGTGTVANTQMYAFAYTEANGYQTGPTYPNEHNVLVIQSRALYDTGNNRATSYAPATTKLAGKFSESGTFGGYPNIAITYPTTWGMEVGLAKAREAAMVSNAKGSPLWVLKSGKGGSKLSPSSLGGTSSSSWNTAELVTTGALYNAFTYFAEHIQHMVEMGYGFRSVKIAVNLGANDTVSTTYVPDAATFQGWEQNFLNWWIAAFPGFAPIMYFFEYHEHDPASNATALANYRTATAAFAAANPTNVVLTDMDAVGLAGLNCDAVHPCAPTYLSYGALVHG